MLVLSMQGDQEQLVNQRTAHPADDVQRCALWHPLHWSHPIELLWGSGRHLCNKILRHTFLWALQGQRDRNSFPRNKASIAVQSTLQALGCRTLKLTAKTLLVSAVQLNIVGSLKSMQF